MARKQKKTISMDVDSALVLMQEIYNDVSENRNHASLIMKKMLSFMKEVEEMTMIGPVIKDQQKILNDCVEKKLSLVKLQSIFMKQQAQGGQQQTAGKLILTDEERDLLEEFLKEEVKDNEDKEKGTYNL